MRADQLLEGGDHLRALVDAADQCQVADVLDPVQPGQVPRRQRPVRRQQAFAHHRAVAQVVAAGGAEHHRALRLGVHQDQADPGWPAR